MRVTFTCTLAMFAILAFTSTVRSQSIDCQCDGEFSVGDRVVTTVDNPGSGNNLPAGSVGTVVCGTTALPYMVVSFMIGPMVSPVMHSASGGDDLGPDTSHWYLLCDQIELVAAVPSIPVGWGWNNQGQSEVPEINLVDISGGGIHSLGLLEDGTAVAWGSNNSGQCDVPEGESFVQVSAGQLHFTWTTCGWHGPGLGKEQRWTMRCSGKRDLHPSRGWLQSFSWPAAGWTKFFNGPGCR